MNQELQLQELRERWKTANHFQRKVIELKAQLLTAPVPVPVKKLSVSEITEIFLKNGEQLELNGSNSEVVDSN